MVVITAQQIKDENNHPDVDSVDVEYLIDNAINYVNLECGTSISNLTGVSPNKTVTVTSDQSAVIKTLCTLMLKAYVDRSPNVAVGGLAVSTMLQDPQFALFMPLFKRGLQRLRGRSFERV